MNKYITKLVPWICGERGFYITTDNLPEGHSLVTEIAIVAIITNDPWEYYTATEPFNHDDRIKLACSQIYQCYDDDIAPTKDISHTHHFNTYRAHYWKQSTFFRLSDDIVLQGDGITPIRIFYDGISDLCQSSHFLGNTVLPDFDTLQIHESIRQRLTSASSGDYIKYFLDIVSRVLYLFLKGSTSTLVAPASTCPQTRTHLDTCMDTCRIEVLEYLL